MADGDLWFNTETGREYVWYVSPSSALGSWVQTQPSGGGFVAPATLLDVAVPTPPTIAPSDAHRTPTITISAIPPIAPLVGDLWWSPVSGQQMVWYDDGNTQQWVISNYGAGKEGPPGPSGLPVGGLPGEVLTKNSTADDDVSWTGPYELAIDLGTTAQYWRGDKTWTTFPAFEPPIAVGTTTQYLRGDKTWQTLDKAAVGLGNVDNTSDANKPISSATQTALDLKADLASPTFTGDPKAPTPVTSDNDTSLATTAFVRAAITTYSPPPDLSGYAPLASPTFTGDPKAPTPTAGDNDTSIATTAFVTAAVATAGGAYLPLAGGTLTGNLLFSPDATVNIGASSTSRPNNIYAGTSVFAQQSLYASQGQPMAVGGASAIQISSTSLFGIYYGSGAPTITAAKGSLYIRQDGAPYYNTSAGATGTTWTAVGSGASLYVGDTAPTVPAPMPGQLWWKSDIGQLFLYYQDPNTTQWVPAAPAPTIATGPPPGAIMDFAGTTAPAGWLICDGSAVSRTIYAALFGVIGTLYGTGDGSTTFTLPDCRGRVIAGLDGGANRLQTTVGNVVGATGGTQTYALAAGEHAAHYHDLGGHNHTTQHGAGYPFLLVNGGEALWTTLQYGTNYNVYYTTLTSTPYNNGNTGVSGGGTPHQNTQPTIMMNKIIKT